MGAQPALYPDWVKATVAAAAIGLLSAFLLAAIVVIFNADVLRWAVLLLLTAAAAALAGGLSAAKVRLREHKPK